MLSRLRRHTQRLRTGVFSSVNEGTLYFELFIISLFFSYQPSLMFGMTSGINLKLGLPILFGTLFVATSYKRILEKRIVVFKNIGLRVFLIFSAINSVSILWSVNKPRALFETGLLWLLFLISVAVIAQFDVLNKNRARLIAILLVSALIVCLFAFWQVIADALGIDPLFTLLSAPYRATLFGFARPTGFALEPQFLANVLIVPIVVAMNKMLSPKSGILPPIVLALSFATIILTISRGGLLAVAMSFILIIIFTHAPLRKYLALAGTMLLGAIIGLVMISTAATLDTRDTITAESAITGIVRHVSLGKIDLEKLLVQQPVHPTVVPVSPATPTPAPAPQPVSIPVYVSESTTSRLQMSEEASKLWLSTPKHFFFGIGVGAFGSTVHTLNPNFAINSIVNNEYLQVASELGLIGLVVFLSLLLLPIAWGIYRRQWIVVVVLIALYSQWFFFSGNINVFHVWVCLALAYGLMQYRRLAHPIKK